jgi:ribosomal protein S12 methylthiotransferase accessory factor YcaO
MLSLAALRYRNVLAAHGGPVERIESGVFPVCGRRMIQANAWLSAGLTPRRALSIYSDADGSGTHPRASVARHMAVSEALERWAFHATVRSARAEEFGFDVDPSSNGMSAFPGIVRTHARRKALLESVERYCLMSWWEGRAEGRMFETDWPGVSAAAIDGPFGGVTVITFARTEYGGYAYGHAAEASFGAACERAVVELARHEWVLRSSWLAFVSGQKSAPQDLFERRCLFFATPEGHEHFLRRLRTRPTGAMVRPTVVCDRDIPGPWAEYATVWRFAMRPPSEEFLHAGDEYFFW